jgi:multidrug efflux pump subunit AcrA (membrane-fusion protein)
MSLVVSNQNESCQGGISRVKPRARKVTLFVALALLVLSLMLWPGGPKLTRDGTFLSANCAIVRCPLQLREGESNVSGTIKWLVDDGTLVKKGDKLLEVDAALGELKVPVGTCVLQAPQDGVVIHELPSIIHFGMGRIPIIAVGEDVCAGQILVRVHDLEEMQVKVLVPPALVGQVQINQWARIRVPARARRLFTPPKLLEPLIGDGTRTPSLRGHVIAVKPPSDDSDCDREAYTVYIAIEDSTNGRILPEMTAEVAFFTGQNVWGMLMGK